MANTAAAGGLMAHQKDEHDIWICKDCGWKYPNAKPSPKIRKHHKKNCPGKAGAQAAADGGGSSDEASDDDHHHHHHRHSSVKGDATPPEINTEGATAPMVPLVESKPRSFEFAAPSAEDKDAPEVVSSEAAPPAAPAENGNAEVASPAVIEQHEEKGVSEAPEAPATSGLMLHQKDEHDLWICKQCGWKYPNAKPSAKVRKHHKKCCPGKGESAAHVAGGVAGGSSDEASDDDHDHHHHHHHSRVPPPVGSVEVSGDARNGSATESPTIEKSPRAESTVESTPGSRYAENGSATETPAIASTDVDIAAIEESPGAEAKEESTPLSGDDDNESAAESPAIASKDVDIAAIEESPPAKAKEESAPVSGDVENESATDIPAIDIASKEIDFAEPNESPDSPAVIEKHEEKGVFAASEAPAASGLMLHQKDEHDVWICKDCGWKYPNAKPSAKIRKHHKKNCSGKGGSAAHAAGAVAGGSSDEASDDDDHHHSRIPPPTGSVEGLENAQNGSAAETPTILRDVSALDDSPLAEAKEEKTAGSGYAENGSATETPTIERDISALEESPLAEAKEESTPLSGDDDNESAAESPAIASKDVDFAAPKELPESPAVIEQQQHEEKGVSASPEAPAASGLIPHQKDEHDIWICKECGWKYPNAKPSAKIRKNHKKHCPGKGESAAGGSSDDASDDDHHHHSRVPPPAGSVEAAGDAQNQSASETSTIERDVAALDELPQAEAKEESRPRSGDVENESATETPAIAFMEIDFAAQKESPHAEVEEESTPGSGDADTESATETPAIASKEIDFAAQKGSPQSEVEEESTPGSGDAENESATETTASSSGKTDIAAQKELPQSEVEEESTPGSANAENESATETPASSSGETDIATQKELPQSEVKEESTPGSGNAENESATETPASSSGETDIAAVEERPSAEATEESTRVEAAATAPTAERETPKGVETSGEEESSRSLGDAATGAVSIKESIEKSEKEEVPTYPVRLQEAMEKDQQHENDFVSKSNPKEVADAAVTSDGLMAHQKDEMDIWMCKECGWKYPNAKPSPKIKKNHKKKCPGHVSGLAAANGGSSDEANDDEQHSTKEKGRVKDAEDCTPSVTVAKGSGEPGADDSGIKSSEFNFSSAVDNSNAAAESQNVIKNEIPAKTDGLQGAAVAGDLFPNQNQECDVRVCKECGWKYPNAKPSPKIRNNHKKKCPARLHGDYILSDEHNSGGK